MLFIVLNGFSQTDTNAVSIDTVEITEDTLSDIWTFNEFENQTGEISELKRNEPFVGGWFFLLNVFLLILFVIKFVLFNEYSRKSWNAWVNNNLFFQFVREKSPINLITFIIESILKIYVVTALFFIGKYIIVGEWQFNWLDFRNLLFVITIFFALKYLLTFLLTFITNQLEEYKVLGLNNIVFISNFAWFIIPVVLIIVYIDFNIRPYLIYTLFGILLFGWIAYLYKCLTIALKMKIRLNVHFFIYLCAFEILPFLFLGKTLQNLNFVH